MEDNKEQLIKYLSYFNEGGNYKNKLPTKLLNN
jgi:hypothetical protein